MLRLPRTAFRTLHTSSILRNASHTHNQPSPITSKPSLSASLSASSRTSRGLPSFRERLARNVDADPSFSFTSRIGRPKIGRQILFATAGSLMLFSWAAEQTNIDTQEIYAALSSGFFRHSPVTSDEMHKARYLALGKYIQTQLQQVKEASDNLPIALRAFVIRTYVELAQPYLDMSEGRRWCWTIGAVNVLVYLAWKIPRFNRNGFMQRWFTHDPLSGRTITLFTSMFSHNSLPHLLFNMLALSSFGAASHLYLTRAQQHTSSALESTANWHFLAFYISSGLFSGLVSHTVSARFVYPRLVSALTKSASATSASSGVSNTAVRNILPSLGASGAIYATVTLTALAFPETYVSLIFPPTPAFPVQAGVGALVLVDLVGIIRGWRIFDHWAHLGGAMAGAWYWYFGPGWWNSWREAAMEVTGVDEKGQELVDEEEVEQ